MEILALLLIIIPLVPLLFRVAQEERDNKAIVDLLESRENGWTWRSTNAISAKTGIPEDQVRQLCVWHNRIERNEERQEMWRLVE